MPNISNDYFLPSVYHGGENANKAVAVTVETVSGGREWPFKDRDEL